MTNQSSPAVCVKIHKLIALCIRQEGISIENNKCLTFRIYHFFSFAEEWNQNSHHCSFLWKRVAFIFEIAQLLMADYTYLNKGWSRHGVMAKVLEFEMVVSLNSCHIIAFLFRLIPFGKLWTSGNGSNNPTSVVLQWWIWHEITHSHICVHRIWH